MVNNPTIQYKDDDDVWYNIGNVLPVGNTNQDFTITLQSVRGIRVHADSFDHTGSSQVFRIYSLYIREGVITSPAIHLGSTTQAIFNAGFNLVSPDKASWGVVGEDGDTTYGVVFEVRGANTEAGLTGAYTAITAGQDIFTVLGATYKWVQWRATLRCKSDPTTYNTAYPQLKYINIEGLRDGAMYNQPHSIRHDERLMWSFPDRPANSFILVYDRLGNFQKHEDKCNLSQFLVFDEELYGAKSGTADGNEIVKYSSGSIADNNLPITTTWKTKTYYSESVMQQVELVKYFITIKNNMIGGSATLTLTENSGGTSYLITIPSGEEQIYSGWFPTGLFFNKNSFTISFSADLEVKQFAIELRELLDKPF